MKGVEPIRHGLTLVPIVLLLAGCASGPATPSGDVSQPAAETGTAAGQTAPSAGGGQAGSSVADAASAVTDWCTLMPTDLVAKIVPGAAAPQSQLFIPLKCTVSNQTSVVEITFSSSAPTDPVPNAESIPDVGAAAYLEQFEIDDPYLTVVLSDDAQAVMYVEVAGHDGKDHKDDAIAVAKAVIAQLQ